MYRNLGAMVLTLLGILAMSAGFAERLKWRILSVGEQTSVVGAGSGGWCQSIVSCGGISGNPCSSGNCVLNGALCEFSVWRYHNPEQCSLDTGTDCTSNSLQLVKCKSKYDCKCQTNLCNELVYLGTINSTLSVGAGCDYDPA